MSYPWAYQLFVSAHGSYLKHDTKDNFMLELNLKKWLIDTSFSNVLRWFDAYETTTVSRAVTNRRWNSETTKRDRLFLENIEM